MALLLGLDVKLDLGFGTLVLYLIIMVDKEMKEYNNRRNKYMRNPECCNYKARGVKR